MFHCEEAHSLLGKPRGDELGRNFALLGHIEHPQFIAKRRLQFSLASDLQVPECFDAYSCRRLWTDGSLVHDPHYARKQSVQVEATIPGRPRLVGLCHQQKQYWHGGRLFHNQKKFPGV